MVYLATIAYVRKVDSHLSTQMLLACEVLAVFGVLALAIISPESNRVARLPALEVWLDRLAAGQFPYASPIRPSGFPGLYILALPFWVTNALRLLPVLGLVVFIGTTHQVKPSCR